MSGQPPWVDDPSALVLVDWSWWLNKSFRLFELEGMVSGVVGWLTQMLAWNPAHVAICLDAPGETWRHRLPHPSDSEWKYKGGRDPKPRDFYTLADRCTELAELHSIPALWSTECEADDIIATATAKARAASYRVYICTADKDLHALCDSTEESGDVVAIWNNFDDWTRGPTETRERFKVGPAQMADYLAICGDPGDNIPGVPGLGGDKAAWLLAQGSLATLLETPPWTVDQHAAVDEQIKALAKSIKKASEDTAAELTARREQLMQSRKVARWHAVLLEHASIARFSRDLTALDCDAPIDIPWELLPVGGFQVDALRARYNSLGFTGKARDVPAFRKRVPWCIPHGA